jgi:Protein tyrosine and serine/threonine kinase
MYTILTGLYPYWEIQSGDTQSVIINGTWPILDDSRYRVPGTVERKLVEVMEQCWTLDPELRPTIFEIIRLLRNITV